MPTRALQAPLKVQNNSQRVAPRVRAGSGICLVTDAAYATNGTCERNDLRSGEYGDLWSILFDFIDNRAGQTEFTKIKSHLDDVGPPAIQRGLARFDQLVGNTLADEVADEAAKRVQVDHGTLRRPGVIRSVSLWPRGLP